MSRGDRGLRPLATQAPMRAVLVLFASSLPLLAQTPPPTPPPAAEPTPTASSPTAVERTPAERARIRAITDLRAASEQLAANAHDFRGEVRVFGPDSADAQLVVPFTGRGEAGLLLHRIGAFTVVTGDAGRQLEHGDGRWRKPDGEAPVGPLAPLPLLRAFVDAEVVHSEAAAFDERPAQRVLATWRGDARKGLLDALAGPNAGLQGKLERIAGSLELARDELITDAVLHYDPATRRLLAATVRVAVFDPDQQGPGDPPRPPAGMAPLAARPVLAFEFEVVLTPPPKEPWPALDAAARSTLQPPPKPPADAAGPAGEPKPVTPR
jgi:hypothetical protein